MEWENQKGYKVLNLIFEHPNKGFTVKEISKKIKVPNTTVQRYLKKLRKNKIITKDNKLIISNYISFLKSSSIIRRMFESGLIDHLVEKLNPSLIIVFGSVRKGEYDNKSDIDLFIESSIKKDIKLEGFEKDLGHEIQLFIESDISKLHKNLFNNIVNGIKLYGSFKIK